MLIVHILLSIFGLVLATVMFFKPSRNKINAAYILLIGTFLSGSYLLLSGGANILKACAMGLVYFSLVAVAIHASEAKLAQNSK